MAERRTRRRFAAEFKAQATKEVSRPDTRAAVEPCKFRFPLSCQTTIDWSQWDLRTGIGLGDGTPPSVVPTDFPLGGCRWLDPATQRAST